MPFPASIPLARSTACSACPANTTRPPSRSYAWTAVHAPTQAKVQAEHGALLPLPAFRGLAQIVGQPIVVHELQEGLLGVQGGDDGAPLDAFPVVGDDLGHTLMVNEALPDAIDWLLDLQGE